MRLLLSLFLLIAVTATAQQVPSKMTVAGVKVTFSEKLRQELQKEVDALTASPKYFRIKVDRANIYFPIIEEIFAEEAVPDDIKYLVLQESALIPDAVSVSDAVGYWQFKDFTAMEVGLRVDNRIDERMHIVASTRGAAQYLKKNYAYFNNWLYAIQAYQMGAGGAMKVVDKSYYGSKSMDLDHNTYWYLKKYIAHKIAFEPAVTGNSSVVLDIYDRASNKTLEQVAKEMSVDYESLVAYNAWLRKGRVPDDKVYPVLLPVSHGVVRPAEIKAEIKVEKNKSTTIPEQIVVSEQNNFPVIDFKNPLFSKERVKAFNGIPGIKAGEKQTVVKLAAAGDVRLNKFLKYNDIDVAHKPKAGQVYYYKRKKAKADIHYHIVMHDETLWDISQKYGIRMKRLMHKNRLLSSVDIKPGLVLWLRHVRPEHIPAEYKAIPEKKREAPSVQEVELKADTEEVEEIKKPAAGEVEVAPVSAAKDDKGLDSLSTIIAENNIDTNDDKKLGADNGGEEHYISHIIKSGETLYSISKKYNVQIVNILTWNNLKATDKLSLGQEVKILQQKDVNAQEELLNLQDKQRLMHTVQAGETLYQISGKYNVTVEDLMEWNEKKDYNLSVGEILQIKR
jgi:membrane-bound lytic murein transglycosylase D